MKVSLNPDYRIKNERGCSYLIIDNEEQVAIREYPPLIGKVLSSFVGRDFNKTVNDIAAELGVSVNSVEKFTQSLVENENEIKQGDILYPVNTLVLGEFKPNVFFADDFNALLPFKSKRIDTPLSISMMITTKCKTDCMYCYADRNENYTADTQEVLGVIEDANECGVMNFTLSGGDILAHPDWRILVAKANSYNMYSLLSTKIPLSNDDLDFLYKQGITSFQFSIDSLQDEVITQMLKVKAQSYLDSFFGMLSYASEIGIVINIKTVLTKINGDTLHLGAMLQKLSQYSCIKNWNLMPAFFSKFKDVRLYAPNKSLLEEVNQFLVGADNHNIRIDLSNIKRKLEKQRKFSSKKDFLRLNKECLAISYSMVILPNKMVTICEMLFSNEEFYIGNIQEQSIREIWNSKKALEFYNAETGCNSSSPCSNCNDLSQCKTKNSKRTCLVDVINENGTENWDYPDPMCPISKSVSVEKILL